jgi:hypothetical protein
VASAAAGQTIDITTIVLLVQDPPGQTASARPASTWATTA